MSGIHNFGYPFIIKVNSVLASEREMVVVMGFSVQCSVHQRECLLAPETMTPSEYISYIRITGHLRKLHHQIKFF